MSESMQPWKVGLLGLVLLLLVSQAHAQMKMRECNLTADATLTNFPYYILSDNASKSYFYNGSIAEIDGAVLQAYEVENWTADNATFWVLTNLTAGQTTTLVQMVNISMMENGTGHTPTAVWDDNYKAVWHFPSNTNNLLDSTSNNEDATNYGTVQDSGVVDGCVNFTTDTGTYIDIPDSFDAFQYGTIEYWAYINTYSFYDTLCSSDNPDPGENDMLCFAEEALPDNDLALRFFVVGPVVGGYFIDAVTPNNSISHGEWFHAAVTVFDGGHSIYINGVNQTLTYRVGNPASEGFFSNISSAQETYVGRLLYAGTYYSRNNGTLDEVRISSVARSAGWINQTYHVVANQSAYVSCGGWTEYPTTTTSTTTTSTTSTTLADHAGPSVTGTFPAAEVVIFLIGAGGLMLYKMRKGGA